MKLRFWRKPYEVTAEEEKRDPCPICVHLNKMIRGKNLPIRPITHGSGSPGIEWYACYEHYKVISAFEWLVLTGQINYCMPSKHCRQQHYSP